MVTQWEPTAPTAAPRSPLFGPCLLWPNGRPSQQLLSSCYNSVRFARLLQLGVLSNWLARRQHWGRSRISMIAMFQLWIVSLSLTALQSSYRLLSIRSMSPVPCALSLMKHWVICGLLLYRRHSTCLGMLHLHEICREFLIFKFVVDQRLYLKKLQCQFVSFCVSFFLQSYLITKNTDTSIVQKLFSLTCRHSVFLHSGYLLFCLMIYCMSIISV